MATDKQKIEMFLRRNILINSPLNHRSNDRRALRRHHQVSAQDKACETGGSVLLRSPAHFSKLVQCRYVRCTLSNCSCLPLSGGRTLAECSIHASAVPLNHCGHTHSVSWALKLDHRLWRRSVNFKRMTPDGYDLTCPSSDGDRIPLSNQRYDLCQRSADHIGATESDPFLSFRGSARKFPQAQHNFRLRTPLA
jgi:hypothetical protein